MNLKISRIFVIYLVWSVIIFLKIFFGSSIGKANYNGYYIVATGALCFILNPNVRILIFATISSSILLFFSKDLIHPAGDFFLLLMILCSTGIAFNNKLSYSDIKVIKRITFLFIAFNSLGVLVPSLYSTTTSDGLRYDGLLHSGNVTVSIFCLCQILYYELIRKYRNTILIISVLLFLIMLIVTKTRSILLFFPYWMYQLHGLNKKVFYCGLIIGVIFIFYSFASIQTNLRLQEDNSMMTRMILYDAMINGILNNYVLLPNGSNSANLLSKEITMNDGFAPHNDFLLYLYDWGLIFLILIMCFFLNIKKRVIKINPFILITLGWLSAGLHNILLYPQIFLIYVIIINLYSHNGYKFNKLSNSSCKKI